MSNAQTILEQMRRNPRDWRIDDVKTVASWVGLDWRQPGTSHVTFRAPNGGRVVVPAHKPIKPVYVKKFVALVDSLGRE
jgi:hypothetical protein